MNTFLINYILHHADSALIISQRNGAWCGHGPVLEQDIAITNITLDLLGQSRNFYQYAAQLMNERKDLSPLLVPALTGERAGAESPGRSDGREAAEDSLAYLRTEREFNNLLLCEQPNGDWAQTILRQYFFSQYQYLLYEQLQHSPDAQLAAIAAKAIKEVTYHLRWSSEWVVRLGDGTAESHQRLQNALAELWPYTGEMFIPADYETAMTAAGLAPGVAALKPVWEQKAATVLTEATLAVPPAVYMHTGGKTGAHTEQLGYILAELQYMQRVYPGCEW